MMALVSPLFPQKNIKHFIYFELERERIRDTSFLNSKKIAGAQLKYTWKELEPEKDRYDFSAIQRDLDFLTSHNKKMWIQLQDVSFDTMRILVPEYLLHDTLYHGGVAMKYEFTDDSETKYRKDGWVARRWDANVSARFHLLLAEMGKQFDGKIEGINLPETSIDFGIKPKFHPSGFTFSGYRDAIIENMKALKTAFPQSVGMIYANFMPGEWLPWTDSGYLRSMYSYAKEIKLAVGGPDLLPYKKGQMNHAYNFIKDCDGIIPSGIAVQEGNYAYVNPQTKRRITMQELIGFAQSYLKLDYMFWCTEEPYYSRDVLKLLKSE